MIGKKQIFLNPHLSFRFALLSVVLLSSLLLWITLSLLAGTLKVAILGGFMALLCSLSAWLLAEKLLIVQVQRLEKAQKKWTDVINSLPDATFVIDQTGMVIVWNQAIENLTGIKSDNMIGKSDRAYAIPFYGEKRNMLIDYVFLPPEAVAGQYAAVKRAGNRLYGEGVIMAHRQTNPVYFWGMASPLYDDAGQVVGAIETIRDISDYKATEKDLLDGRAKYEALFDSANDAVTLMIDDKFIDCNKKALALFGCTKEAFIGQTPQCFSPEQQPDGTSSVRAALAKINGALQGTPQFFTWTHCRLDGKPFDTEISLDTVRLENGEVIIQSIIRDITARKEAEETIRQFAYHDTLTGLPNRRLLYDRFHLEIANAERGKRTFAVMMFDIDHFKNVNDTLGHHTGDLLLQNVAYRMWSNLRKGDTLARFGGDEFIVLLPEVTQDSDAAAIARKILRAFKKPFSCDGNDIFVTTSIGIAMYPGDGQDMETLIRHADRALYRAKDAGRNTCTFFGSISPEDKKTGEPRYDRPFPLETERQ